LRGDEGEKWRGGCSFAVWFGLRRKEFGVVYIYMVKLYLRVG
jgi:hypothetical protein